MPTEVLSSDFCRGLVSDDENDQAATNDAFEVLQFIAAKRLAAGRLTVVDATNVQPEARKPLVALAREYDVLPTAIVFNLPERLCQERNRGRPDRDFGAHVIRRQSEQLRRSLKDLSKRGLPACRRTPLSGGCRSRSGRAAADPGTNRRTEHGPFDIIGDVHGCVARTRRIAARARLGRLGRRFDGARIRRTAAQCFSATSSTAGLTFRPCYGSCCRWSSQALRCAFRATMTSSSSAPSAAATCKLAHGLAESLAQLEGEPPEFKEKAAAFLDKLISHFVLDDGNLVVAHAGMQRALPRPRAHGASATSLSSARRPARPTSSGYRSALRLGAEYRGHAMVVYGHTPVPEAVWVNGTINIDTGCVFGGRLTALRYPERELVSVPARETYYEPAETARRCRARAGCAAARRRHSSTSRMFSASELSRRASMRKVTIREENATAALEVMSRLAAGSALAHLSAADDVSVGDKSRRRTS